MADAAETPPAGPTGAPSAASQSASIVVPQASSPPVEGKADPSSSTSAADLSALAASLLTRRTADGAQPSQPKPRVSEYPASFEDNAGGSTRLMSAHFDKGQEVEVKSILRGPKPARSTWGGGRGNQSAGGARWVAARIRGVHRGGAGYWNVYVPQSVLSESNFMHNTVYTKVPSSCIRPRRRRRAHGDAALGETGRRVGRVKVIEEIRREEAEEAAALRCRVRELALRRGKQLARRLTARRMTREAIAKREAAARSKKRRGRTRTRARTRPATARTNGKKAARPRQSSAPGRRGNSLQGLVAGLDLGLARAARPQTASSARRPGPTSGPYAAPAPFRDRPRGKARPKSARGSVRKTLRGGGSGTSRNGTPATTLTPRQLQAWERVADRLDAAGDKKKASSARTAQKQPDWFETWTELEALDPASRALVLEGDMSDTGLGVFDPSSSVERQKGAVRRLWALLRVPKAEQRRQQKRLFGRTATQRSYAEVLQQASWLRRCLSQLLNALRAVEERERRSEELGAAIRRQVEAALESWGPAALEPVPADIAATAEDLARANAAAAAAILAWNGVCTWLPRATAGKKGGAGAGRKKPGSFLYKGNDYMEKIRRDERFLDTLLHVAVAHRIVGPAVAIEDISPQ